MKAYEVRVLSRSKKELAKTMLPDTLTPDEVATRVGASLHQDTIDRARYLEIYGFLYSWTTKGIKIVLMEPCDGCGRKHPEGEGYCRKSEDGIHSEEWYDCEACRYCGEDTAVMFPERKTRRSSCSR